MVMMPATRVHSINTSVSSDASLVGYICSVPTIYISISLRGSFDQRHAMGRLLYIYVQAKDGGGGGSVDIGASFVVRDNGYMYLSTYISQNTYHTPSPDITRAEYSRCELWVVRYECLPDIITSSHTLSPYIFTALHPMCLLHVF